MKHYIQQLIEDIRKVSGDQKHRENLGLRYSDEPDPEDMAYVERFIEGKQQSIAWITGLEQAQFPPPERLTTEQQELLSIELEELLQNFHFVLDFPENYPVYLRYSFIRDFWLEKQVPMSFGESHIEFCDYEEENCPFPGYCTTCQDIKEEFKSSEGLTNKTDVTDINVEDLLMSAKEMEDFFRQRRNLTDHDDDNDHDNDENNDVPPNSDLPF